MNSQSASIFQPEHLILILVLVLLFFGSKKIPELMRGIGQGVREFNNAKTDFKSEIPKTPLEKKSDNEPITEKKAE